MMLLPSSSGNLLCLLFMLGFGSFVLAKLPPLVRVGSVFLETEQEVHEGFRLAVESLKSRQLLNETDIEFDIQYATPRDYFHLYTRACVELGNGAVSMFGPSDPSLDEQLESISNVLGVPLISTASRTRIPHTSDVSMDFTLSLHPTQNQLMNMIKDLAKELKWKDISIIHDPAHGIIDPTSVAESLQILGRVSVHKASTDLRATLVQLRLAGARNVIVDTSVANVQSVIQAALDTGMMTKQYSYIFTMLDMKAGNWSRLSYSEALVFGFNIIDEGKFDDFQQRYASSVTGGLEGTTRLALTLDAVELLARGLEALDDAGTDLSSQTPVSCTAERKWDIGEDLKDAYSSVTFDGMTGPISFSHGLRSRVNVNILRLNYNNELGSPSFVTVGNWSEGNYYDGNPDGLQMLDRALLTNEKPEINKTLIVTTMSGSSCMIKSEITGEEEGFCVDLADHLSKLLGFYYKFKTVNDGRYGKADPMTGQWDGMIGEVIRGEADLALADLTVTAARESVVDFTTPFLHTSLAILYKNADASMEGISSLLSPFSIWVWVSIALAFFVTSVSLRFVAWLSPFQKDEIIIPGSERSPSLGQDLSWINSMWLLASTLVLRGCDIRLQSASSRTIAIAWWLFSLLILVIYASLVSHWFDVSGGKGLKTIDGLLQNAELEIGVIRGGSTHNFLQNAKQDDLQKVWWRVQKSLDTVGLQPNTQAGIEEVQRSEGNFAFMSEERNVERALADDCSLGLVEGIDMRAFAVAVSKGSPLRAKISEGILMLRENGVLHQLEEKWWPTPACEQKGEKPQVQLVNFVGPLTLLVFGVVVAVCLAMFERLCYHRRSHRGFFRTATENGNGKIAINQMHDTEST